MLDIKYVIENTDLVKEKIKNKKGDEKTIDYLIYKYKKNKSIRQDVESMTALQKKLSQQMGMLKKEGKDVSEILKEINQLKENKIDLERNLKEKEESLNDVLMSIPNLYDDTEPVGNSEEDNIILEKIGEPKQFNFEPKQHWDIGVDLNIIDFERAVKLTKSRFSSLRGVGARLERALINYMLDFNRERGFEEWCVPFMANSNALRGTGQLPKFEEDLFKIDDEDLYLIPTAEVSLTNLYNDEIIDQKELPLLMTSYTPCFRKEAGAAGRDTRGLIRQHQFDKVEMVAITKQEESDEIFEKMVQCASDLLTSLELPHQKVQLCTGDLGFSAAKTIDLEVWLPGQNTYREISSISNTRDFQSRRAKIRYKNNDKKNVFTHTLNGSSLAVGRTLVAILENHQQEDGSIKIPKVLEKYM